MFESLSSDELWEAPCWKGVSGAVGNLLCYDVRKEGSIPRGDRFPAALKNARRNDHLSFL